MKDDDLLRGMKALRDSTQFEPDLEHVSAYIEELTKAGNYLAFCLNLCGIDVVSEMLIQRADDLTAPQVNGASS